MDPNVQLSTNQSLTSTINIAAMKLVPYRSTLGSLMYLAVGTRPDIAFTISTLAQYTENPGLVHWEALKRVYCYLVSTKTWSLTHGTERKGLIGNADTDSGDMVTDTLTKALPSIKAKHFAFELGLRSV